MAFEEVIPDEGAVKLQSTLLQTDCVTVFPITHVVVPVLVPSFENTTSSVLKLVVPFTVNDTEYTRLAVKVADSWLAAP